MVGVSSGVGGSGVSVAGGALVIVGVCGAVGVVVGVGWLPPPEHVQPENRHVKIGSK